MIMVLRNIVEAHYLKLKPSYKGSTGKSIWTLHINTYPILTFTNEQNLHWNKSLINLSNIILKSDKLHDIPKFYNSVNTTFFSTLATNKRMGVYKELTSLYNIKDKITLPTGHIQHTMGQTACEHVARIIRDHITKKETIVNEKSKNNWGYSYVNK